MIPTASREDVPQILALLERFGLPQEWTSTCPVSAQAIGASDESDREIQGASFWRQLRPIIQNQMENRKERAMGITTEQVWEAFHTPLYQFIRHRVADEATAEDLLQEVFLKIHQHGSSLKDTKHLESWIYQIARNLIIDVYRSHRQNVTSLEATQGLDLPEELPDDDIVSELLPCIRAMVLALPDQDRQALILTEYQGLTQKELGEHLGLSFSGAKSRVQRAREKLKQQLLACCHFELDRRGHVLDYQPRCDCYDDAAQTANRVIRPFSPKSVSTSKGKREGLGALLMVLNGKE